MTEIVRIDLNFAIHLVKKIYVRFCLILLIII